MSSISVSQRFRELKRKNEGAFIPFITAGFPDIETSRNMIMDMAEAGADLIEVGVAFSDPMADGPTVQASSKVALENGITLQKTLEIVREVRDAGVTTPVVLMGYANPFLAFGLEEFAEKAGEAGVNGLIVPDLPPVEAAAWRPVLQKKDIDIIMFLSPTTGSERMKQILSEATGFLYCLSVTGVTGARGDLPEELFPFLARTRKLTELPLVVGFGVSTTEHVRRICESGDGAVIASALLNGIMETHQDKRREFVKSFVKTMKQATVSGS